MIASPVDLFESLDASELKPSELYKLLIGGILPRPIAFVSTLSKAGIGNLAPFSFFNGVSSNPPCLVFSVTRKPDASKKDTLLNIEETGEFVVNTVSEWMTAPMHQCSAAYPYGVDEMQEVGLTPVPSDRVKPPRVKESPIHFECRLHKLVEIGEGQVGSATLVIGQVLKVHVWQRAYSDGKIRAEEIKPLARLGGRAYGKLGEIFELPGAQV